MLRKVGTAVLVAGVALGARAADDLAPWDPLLASAEASLDRGDVYAAERDWLEAEREIATFGGGSEELARVNARLGALYARTGRPTEARVRFERALAHFDASAERRSPETRARLVKTLDALASLALREGEPTRAVGFYERVLRLQAEDPPASAADRRATRECLEEAEARAAEMAARSDGRPERAGAAAPGAGSATPGVGAGAGD